MFVLFSIKREPPLRSKLLLGSGGFGACGDRLKNYVVGRPFGFWNLKRVESWHMVI